MTVQVKSPKKLIEVAVPLDVINNAAIQEKSNPFLKGHPRNIHQWWARRPMAVARAVIFAQTVNDPGFQQGAGFRYGKNKKEAAVERQRLFKIIEELVKWENSTNEKVIEDARSEIWRSWREVCDLNVNHPQASKLFNPDQLPGLHDPFAGGGAIPLEAQRLGFAAFASDLNPVAVLINKALVEIPFGYLGHSPICPTDETENLLALTSPSEREWRGTSGLAEDLRRYARWMDNQLGVRLESYYPSVSITSEVARGRPDLKKLVGARLKVIATIWARTVNSPSPAFSHVAVPLASSFVLSAKDGKEACVVPVVEGDYYGFTVKTGKIPERAKSGTKLSRGANFQCVLSKTNIEPDYIKAEGIAGRLGTRMMGIVADGPKGRVFLPPTSDLEGAAEKAVPDWRPDVEISGTTQYLGVVPYGMTKFSQLFTNRQLVTLNTISDLIGELRKKIMADFSGSKISSSPNAAYGTDGSTFADAVATYMALALDKIADYNNMLCTWNPTNQNIGHLFTKQAIPMTWDFVEMSPLCGGLSFDSVVDSMARTIEQLPANLPIKNTLRGIALQAAAQTQEISFGKIISTDPPYYDNVPYSDLADFFYVWLRKSLKTIYPELFSTLTTPKNEELVAFGYRHNGKEGARRFFLNGMGQAIHSLATEAHPDGPITIYYAFKQADTDEQSETFSTGWATFLEAINRAGLQLTGTWPMRTEREQRSRGQQSNALASSIILVCRKKPINAPTISRREFLRELAEALPNALDEMTRGAGVDNPPVAPVDLSQAIIGPGISIFTKYSSVLEADGSEMSMRTALKLINRFLAEDDFDSETQFCLQWFDEIGWVEGAYGIAEKIATSKGIAVEGVESAGVLLSGKGKVRLMKWDEYPAGWNPRTDNRRPVWETLHHLIRAMRHEGESFAGRLLAQTASQSEAVRQLAYRLYTLCDRKGWSEDARIYNELVTSWSGIEEIAVGTGESVQQSLFGEK